MAIGCELPLASGPMNTSEWKTMSWSWLLSGPGGWLTVKVGKVKVEGNAPVVNTTGSEPVPSLNTCRIWYVVFGSMPATKKLVLVPAVTARASVFRQAGSSPAAAN